ncbi:MAG: hypothetical protein ACREDO_03325 [Methyloceanibacter sp.]
MPSGRWIGLAVTRTPILVFSMHNDPFAADLHVSCKTIANTCSQLKTKLGVHSLPELMRIAIESLPAVPGKSFKD